jgi:hypothetical protein
MPPPPVWLRRCITTFLICATPSMGWATVSATNDCILSWDPVTRNIDGQLTSIQGYKVYTARENGTTLTWARPSVVPPSTAPQATCKALGLNETGVYALSVTAYNTAFESHFSEVVKVSLTVDPLTLTVAGAPNLPLHGTTAQVTVGITGETPTQVQLSLDGQPFFATWPADAFFTWSPDGRSLTGSWCITSACWGGVAGAHVLYVVATYAAGATTTAAVLLNVTDAGPAH